MIFNAFTADSFLTARICAIAVFFVSVLIIAVHPFSPNLFYV